MHAIDQISLRSFHLQHSNMTSGERYCLVFIIPLPISSCSTAEPKSIIFISVFINFLYKVFVFFSFIDLDLDFDGLDIFFVLIN